MFATFTGNSRRPRNVNLSGQAGNPFTNTSWTPSSASNPNRAVAEAQANREKRHAERERLKAAKDIQRTWRAHKTRLSVCESHRQSFDGLYKSDLLSPYRLPRAFPLLLSFFTVRRSDDIQRLLCFATECEAVDLALIAPTPHRMSCLIQILVDSLNFTAVRDSNASPVALVLLNLADRILYAHPIALSKLAGPYYAALAHLSQTPDLESRASRLLVNAFSTPLKLEINEELGKKPFVELEAEVYKAIVVQFLARKEMLFFEHHTDSFSKHIKAEKLASAILEEYASRLQTASSEKLLWLLAHFIGLGGMAPGSSHRVAYLEALYTQISVVSQEISVRIGAQHLPAPPEPGLLGADGDPSHIQPLEPYVKAQLLSLVNHEAISRLLQDFYGNLSCTSSQQLHSTSLLAGYISTLLLCFPTVADEIRMRLFLASIPTSGGEVSVIKLLWQAMRQSSLFYKIVKESQAPEEVLRNYARGAFHPSQSTLDEQEWRVALMFLELYIFLLRLSDDEDFFSGINPQLIADASPSESRIRASSLSLDDLKLLSTFLKNTAFALHYKARQISQTRYHTETAATSRLNVYLGTKPPSHPGSKATSSQNTNTLLSVSTKLDLGSLREIVTTAMKMLYERDSRKQFLPIGHWLMTSKLDKEDFVGAVIAEDERQRQEDDDSENDDDDDNDNIGLRSTDIRTANISMFQNARLSHNARLEAMRLRQKQAQKERRLAEMGPKLEILKHMPFVVPFEARVKIFRQFVLLDRLDREQGNLSLRQHSIFDDFSTESRHRANIRRGHLFDDAFEKFYNIGDGLKDPINITFVDQFGTEEAGIDGGGVTKEFLTSVTTEAFGNNSGKLEMFSSSEKGLLYPNPIAVDNVRESLRRRGMVETDPEWRDKMSKLLKRYEFLGRIVGKCMYQGILVDLSFAGFFLLQWPSTGPNEANTYKGSVNDLRDMDEELYKGMLRIKNFPGDISELGIDFTITDQASLPHEPPKTITRSLMPDGDTIFVTNDNRLLYISYIARHRLVIQPGLQTAAFLRGLRTIIRPSWLSMFNPPELQRLVGGDSSEIDIDDLRRNTVYSGLYVIGDDKQEHPTIKLFWKVMEGFDDQQKRNVLKYVSSTPRAPLLGFSQLKPKFSIRDGGTDENRLPSTSTCVNLLKLPRYTTERTLREKLIYAIESGAGFDLS